ncbi:hypothetical protein NUU61_008290 [Penicillium alfredii]|uniref:Uncharacterized protein n=1 Tax=Penicillium alfredii TaxID=1506179 RepID=A0A9W9JZ46_9EURO|nr:uncharacterized protein NUU61_008290 [Penicillium alfredii]KAJ5086983.1 hypothetical protein NUU61_008290 [Penicillium alfredii]
MDMPNIPDNRPHKSPVAMEFPDMLDRRSPKPPGDRDGPEAPQQKPPSVLSYTPTTPTIVLDSESEFDAQSRHSGQQSFNSHDLGDEG